MATIIRRINSVKRCKAILTQSEIQGLNTTPIEIIPTPNINQAIHIVAGVANLDHQGIDYTGSSNLSLGSTGKGYSGRSFRINGVANATADKIVESLVVVGGDGLADVGVEVSNQSDLTGAGGVLTIFVLYTIFDYNSPI